ncbi:MAG: glycosyltransferase family 2 protein, partial [Campylobacterales bacterium]|nr:glycosyltransferase family 2 protein [Campylobacterales bacterium]
MTQLNASIVLFHNQKEQLIKVINSFLNTDLKVKLYLVDNSSNDELKVLREMDSRIEYIFNNANLGYGAGHNIAMRKSISDGVLYHLVLNPDIYFEGGTLEELFSYMEQNQDVGNIIPQVRYPDGEIQHLCKLLPTPVDLVLRRFIPSRSWKEKRNEQYELRWTGYNKVMNVPSLSGCFMFLRVSVLQNVGLFDENIFMYLEDTDLNRRIHSKYKTLFYPKVEIVHEYAKESYKSKKLLKYHIKSAIYYFNKWGWIFDKERNLINSNAIK